MNVWFINRVDKVTGPLQRDLSVCPQIRSVEGLTCQNINTQKS